MEEADGRSRSRLIVDGPRIMGLDLMIGGAIPMLARHGDKPQTSILIRGDAGTGKTVLASYLAGEFAKQFNSDVAYACIELLPIELAAQAEGLYPGDTPPFRVIHDWTATPDTTRPSFWTGMLDLGDRLDHTKTRERFLSELPQLLEAATAKSVDRGVRVLVVDSVSPHYGLGADAPRMFADDLCKWAASRGIVLIVIEETSQPSSVWSFATDLVLALANESSPSGERCMRAPKNRFGPSVGAVAASFSILEAGPEIRPHPAQYVAAGPTAFMLSDVEPLHWQSARLVDWGVSPLHESAVLAESLDHELLAALIGTDAEISVALGTDLPSMQTENSFLGSDGSAAWALAWLRRRLQTDNRPLWRVALYGVHDVGIVAQALRYLCATRTLVVETNAFHGSSNPLFMTHISVDSDGVVTVQDADAGLHRFVRSELLTPTQSR